MSDSNAPYDKPEWKTPESPTWAARRRAAEAARKMIENFVICTAEEDTLNQLADQLEAAAEKLAETPLTNGRFEGSGLKEETFNDRGYELGPVEGRCNPLAAPLTTWINDKGVHGRVNMGWRYEGPPYTVHGGHVAALFDQFLGVGQKTTGTPGVTGELSIRYHKMTPLNTDLELFGWLEKSEGRKIVMSAEIRANGEVTASCKCLFIRLSKASVEQIHQKTM
ncbi:PaaI family thioesterase [Endozoicomonas sp. OPT23]|uniref:PaaI family thioesterase n=1 Tax=Endozoicomonas sp. OPT23 TaxID=2072845 RepID=UPI00129AEE42|nr:PaaI family thioesterase [Endozoicomonas sp. OPT23]MRI32880.1 PaaI family thioesterase [Endozoicomonas sp. OPT23]